MALSQPESLALGFCAGLALGLVLLIRARRGATSRPHTSVRGSGAVRANRRPSPSIPTAASSGAGTVDRPSLATSEREVAAAWLQFLRREVGETVSAINSRLTVVKTLLGAFTPSGGSQEQRDALERIHTELDRAAATTAELHRQVSSSAPAPARPSIPAAQPRAVSAGLLLVVESDDTTRDVIGRLFGSMGHQVIPARDGVEAFAILEQEPVECVICETRVSRLGGEGLYTQVEQRLPHLARRFVFISGDTQIPEVRDFLDRSGRPVVPKPFDAEVLVEVVHGVLAAVQASPHPPVAERAAAR